MNALLSNTKRLQHHLLDKVIEAQVNIFLDKESEKDSARLRFLQGKGAGSWLNVIPSTQNLAILLGNFRLAAFIRLRMAMPLPLLADEYESEYGKTIDSWRWTSVVSQLYGFCVGRLSQPATCIPYYVEPKDCYTTSNGRSDIYVAESFCMPAAELDIALLHPFSKDILSI